MSESVHSPIPHSCAVCKRQLGLSVGVVPHYIGEDNGEGGGKREAFCPRCFVYRIAPQHPHPTASHGRFAPHWHPRNAIQATMRAVVCRSPKCMGWSNGAGVETLAHGHTGCPMCGNTKGLIVVADEATQAIMAAARS